MDLQPADLLEGDLGLDLSPQPRPQRERRS